jgi:hypothetical protein
LKGGGGRGSCRLDVLAVPVLNGDGMSMLVGMRMVRDNDNNNSSGGGSCGRGASATHTYVVRIGLPDGIGGSGSSGGGWLPYFDDVVWLDRYLGPSLLGAFSQDQKKYW